jgi:hypothetical protein
MGVHDEAWWWVMDYVIWLDNHKPLIKQQNEIREIGICLRA